MSPPPIKLCAEDLDQRETLPCGCVVGIWTDAFVIIPCAPTCENYRYTLSEARRTATPVSFGEERKR